MWIQNSGYCWAIGMTDREQERGLGDACNVLLIVLDAGFPVSALWKCINWWPYDLCLFKNECYTLIKFLCKKSPNFWYEKSLYCASLYINSVIPHNGLMKDQWCWVLCKIGLYKFEIPWHKIIIINYCCIHRVWDNSNPPNLKKIK